MKYLICIFFLLTCTPDLYILKLRESKKLMLQQKHYIDIGEKTKADSVRKAEAKVWDF